ncbi:SGNH/GDSL hydrolase family protein [Legionella sp. CNM-1927-20]|uniref:SGNH/GDSL hydrolase family protein n=1 Tax=Legionella sp. CNM-1927-20 TaxID=3422221 RepID=UPI00403AAE08
MKKIIMFCFSLLLTLHTYAFNNRFDTMVIFGDSLSDNGNLYNYMWHYLPSSPPYYLGRFSDGPVWTEYLYADLFPETYIEGFQDYAVGGAGAVLSYKENLPFTLAAELNNYFYWHTYGRKDTTLYTIWIGANNYINEPTNVEDLTTGVVNAIGNAVERLIAKGGNKFVLINLPDLARLPHAKNSSRQWLLTYLAETHNRKLTTRIDELKLKYPQVLFLYFDAYNFFNQSIDHSEDYGFINTDEPCYLGSYTGWLNTLKPDDETLFASLKARSPKLTEKEWLLIKNNPQLYEAALTSYLFNLLPANEQTEPMQCGNYVFWDQVHPTTAVHKIIAQQVRTLIDKAGLQPVLPE